MITLHWTHILAALILIVAFVLIGKIQREGGGGWFDFTPVFSLIVLLIAAMVIAIIGGIWWW